MTHHDIPAVARILAQRQVQGLPPRVTDPDALRLIGTVVSTARRMGERDGGT